jgi:hypothetical protein
MARVSDNVLPSGTQVGLTLDRYQEIMRLPVDSFNGINNPDTRPDSFCSTIWTQTERDQLAMFITMAEEMREKELGWHLGYKAIYAEQHDYAVNDNPYILNKKHLVAVGIPTLADIQDDADLTALYAAGSDPLELVIYTDIDPDEIVVCYPGEEVQIHPYSIVQTTGGYGGTYVTIKMPWARLVKPELNDDRDDPLEHDTITNYLETVDIKRYYRVADGAAQYVWLAPNCNVTDCEGRYQDACVRILGPSAYRLSQIWLEPATFSSDTPTASRSFTYAQYPDFVTVTYVSGRKDMLNEMLTGRLTHAIMPFGPCDCRSEPMYWQRDQEPMPGVNTPYGSNRAAIDVWMADSRSKVGAGGKFPRIN